MDFSVKQNYSHTEKKEKPVKSHYMDDVTASLRLNKDHPLTNGNVLQMVKSGNNMKNNIGSGKAIRISRGSSQQVTNMNDVYKSQQRGGQGSG
jgi:hypothetical protein